MASLRFFFARRIVRYLRRVNDFTFWYKHAKSDLHTLIDFLYFQQYVFEMTFCELLV